MTNKLNLYLDGPRGFALDVETGGGVETVYLNIWDLERMAHQIIQVIDEKQLAMEKENPGEPKKKGQFS